MKTIWKKQLFLNGSVQNIQIPKGSEILNIQFQGDLPTIWFLVPDTQAENQKRKFIIYLTGQEIQEMYSPLYPEKPLDQNHIGTLQRSGLVYHIFEIIINTTLDKIIYKQQGDKNGIIHD